MNFTTALLASALAITMTTALGTEADDLKPYPASEAEHQRLFFRVPAVENEAERRVEIIVGKTMEVDCNKTWFGADLEHRVAEGWGYPFYVVDKIGPAAGTLMACPPDSEMTEAFVSVRGEGFLIRYNSKLPVVVYVPNGFEVRYRIWSASAETSSAAPE